MKVVKVVIEGELPESCFHCEFAQPIDKEIGEYKCAFDIVNKYPYDRICSMVKRPIWCPLMLGWISVKDRLPEEKGRYFIHRHGGARYTAEYLPNLKAWLTFAPDHITHWMPLPQPPENEEG